MHGCGLLSRTISVFIKMIIWPFPCIWLMQFHWLRNKSRGKAVWLFLERGRQACEFCLPEYLCIWLTGSWAASEQAGAWESLGCPLHCWPRTLRVLSVMSCWPHKKDSSSSILCKAAVISSSWWLGGWGWGALSIQLMLQQMLKRFRKDPFSDDCRPSDSQAGGSRGLVPVFLSGKIHSFSKNLLNVWVHQALLGVKGPVGAKPRGHVPGSLCLGQRSAFKARLKVCPCP